MKRILLTALLGICISVSGQEHTIIIKGNQVSGDFSISPSEYKVENLDKSKVNIYYNTSFVSNPNNATKKKQGVSVLQIGEKYSKFVDNNQLKIDSLDSEFSKLPKVGAKELNLLLANKVQWRTQVFKNKTTQKNTILENTFDNYQYTEAQPKIDWKINSETKEILGYKCREATAKYRGRDYTAWYSEDLPFSDGPHQFAGLPGLILEIYDNQEHYHFTAIAIDTKEKSIYQRAREKEIKTTREKFRKASKSYHQNPGFNMNLGEVYDANGNPMKIKSKEIPYNPIELE